MANITNTDDVLAEHNYQKFVLLIPIVVYVSILMAIGLFGNVLVCVYYGCKTRSSTSSFFIVSLAVFDLMVCSITMPNEIVDLRYMFVFNNISACKIPRFINHIAANGSATVLLVIAFDRYRRMCRPLRPQLEIKHAKIAILCSIIFSLFLSWPAAIFYMPVAVQLRNNYNDSVLLNGSVCTTTRDDEYKLYLWAFNILQFVIFVIATLILCVLYSLVGRSIYRYKKRRLIYASTRRLSRFSHNHDSIQNGCSELSIKTIESTLEVAMVAVQAKCSSELNKHNGYITKSKDERKSECLISETKCSEEMNNYNGSIPESNDERKSERSNSETKCSKEMNTYNGSIPESNDERKSERSISETKCSMEMNTYNGSIPESNDERKSERSISETKCSKEMNTHNGSVPDGKDGRKTERSTCDSNGYLSETRFMSGSCNSLPELKEKCFTKEKLPDINTVKSTIQMIVIAAIYILGYLPYLVLVIWRIFQPDHEGEILNDTQYLWFNIGLRSYLLNSAINPIVYGFFNEHFRRFFYVLFCPCCNSK